MCAEWKGVELADINVERRGPTVWPWIVGIIILVLLIWAIAEIVDRSTAPPQPQVEVVPEAVPPGPPVRAPGAPTTPSGTAPPATEPGAPAPAPGSAAPGTTTPGTTTPGATPPTAKPGTSG
jgi:hypothetical protein